MTAVYVIREERWRGCRLAVVRRLRVMYECGTRLAPVWNPKAYKPQCDLQPLIKEIIGVNIISLGTVSFQSQQRLGPRSALR